jgi:hypothetical protein
MFRSAQRDFGIAGGEEGHLLPPGVGFVLASPEVTVELTPMGRAVDEHGNPTTYTITIFSDENGNGTREINEAQRIVRQGKYGISTMGTRCTEYLQLIIVSANEEMSESCLFDQWCTNKREVLWRR